MKRWALFTLVLLTHLALSAVALLWTLGISSDQFEGRAVSTLANVVAHWLLAITWCPLNLFALSASAFPGLLGWIPVIGNSLIWASVITWASHRLCRSTRSRSLLP